MKQILRLPAWVFISAIILPVVFWAIPLFTGQSLYWGAPILQFIPWKIEALEQLINGIFPLWNSGNGLGSPLMANYQTALFYPPGWMINILGLLCGSSGIAWGYTFMLAAHGAWSSLGMAFLVKRYTNNSLSMVVAGISYSLGSYFIARAGFFPMVWVGAWFPWMMISIACDIEQDRQIWKIRHFPFASIVVISCALLGGHAQLCWYMLLFSFFWMLLTVKTDGKKPVLLRKILSYCCYIGIAVMICAVQLIPTAELLLISQRAGSVAYESGLAYSFWPWRLITYFAPDFFGNPGYGDWNGYGSFWEDAIYIGVIPIFMAIGTIKLLFKKKDQGLEDHRGIVVYLWVMIVIAIVFALGKNTPIFPFLYRYIPTFDMFNAPARYMLWAHMSLCLLAAIGISRWQTPSGKGLYWLRLGTAGGFSILITTIIISLYFPNIRDSFIRSSITFGVLAIISGVFSLTNNFFCIRNKQNLWVGMVVAVTFIDLFLAGQLLNPMINADSYSNFEKINNKSIVGRVYLEPEIEYSLKFARYMRFNDYRPIEETENLFTSGLPNTNLLQNIDYVNNFDPILPNNYAQLMNLLPDMDTQEHENWLRLMDVTQVIRSDLQSDKGVSHINLKGSKRIWWFPCANNVKNSDAALNASRSLLKHWIKGSDLERIVIEEKNISLPVEKECIQSQLTYSIIEENPLSMTLNVSISKDGWLMIGNSWYPGWKATIDGEKTEIYRGFSLFQVIRLPAGNHNVELQYKPLSVLIGLIISGIALTFLAVIGVISRKKHIPVDNKVIDQRDQT
jgi:hypothetical protein